MLTAFSCIIFLKNWTTVSNFKFFPYLNILQNFVQNVGYHSYRCGRHGGGVSIFISNRVDYLNTLTSPFTDKWESLFIEVMFDKKKIIVGEVYRIPNTNVSTFTSELASYLDNLKYEIVVIGTDQNVDYLSSKNNKDADHLLETMLSRLYLPVITRPTRVTHSTATLIDNIYIKCSHLNPYSSCILIEDISDHYPCLLQLQTSKCSDGYTYFYTRKMSEQKYYDLNHLLLHHDWSCMSSNNAEWCYNYLSDTIQKYLDKIAPIKTEVVSDGNVFTAPWMNVKLCKYVRKSKKLFKKYKQSHTDKDLRRYRTYRNVLNRLKKFEKKEFYSNLFKKYTNDTRAMWNILNSLIRNRNQTSDIVSITDCNTKTTVTDPLQICTEFNNHFANAGKNVQDALKKPTSDSLKHVKYCEKSLQSIVTNETEVERIIMSLKSKISSGHDKFSNVFLKKVALSIRYPLMLCCNKSFAEGVVPNKMKIAKIIPLHKKGSAQLCDNYRPISLLPTMSKVIEKIVYRRVTEHLSVNDILYYRQYGFRANHSTTDAVCDLVSEILQGFDKEMSCLSVMIDLRKAFDSCDHSLMLKKLEKMGIRGDLLRWFTSYLSARTQYVSIANSSSDINNISVGVPQGSLLGVLLFVIQINDLHSALKYSQCILYADDTTIFVIGRNIKCMIAKIQEDLKYLETWLVNNRLCLNTDKTKVMLFSKRIHHEDINITLSGVCLELVNEFKLLGIWLDTRLAFEIHAQKLYATLLQMNYLCVKMSKFVPVPCLKSLYFAHFHSRLNYGICIWGGLITKYYVDKLFKLQKKIMRVVTCSAYHAHSMPIFKENHILCYQDLVKLDCVKLVYRCINGLAPKNLQQIFKCNREISTRNKNLIVLKHKTTIVNKSFLVSSISTWNKLTVEQKQKPSIASFKSSFKKSSLMRY